MPAARPLFKTVRKLGTPPQGGRSPVACAQAWRFIEALRAGTGLRMLVETDRHPEMLALTLTQFPSLRGSILHDVHTAVLMREHGIRRIYTRDTDLHRLPFLEVVDPLRSDWSVEEALGRYGGAQARSRGPRSRMPPATRRPRSG